MALFSLSMIWFTIKYLHVQNKYWKWVFIGLVVIRILVTLIFINELNLSLYHIDALILTVCFAISIKELYVRFDQTKYFVAGFTCLWVTFIIYYFSVIGFTSLGGFSFFAMYYGVVAEAVFFTFGIAQSIRNIHNENEENELLNKYLETEVQKRTSTIVEQNELLENQKNELNEFLYRSSHDIVAPIKTIEGLCSLYHLENSDIDNSEIIKNIQSQTVHLESLVQNLQNILSVKNQKHHFKPYSINELISSIQHNLSTIVKDVTISFHNNTSNDVTINTDINDVKNIMTTLTENAIKFKDTSKEQSVIEVRFDVDVNYFYITISDNGLGMNEITKVKAFDMFYRGNEVVTKGSGLGLYLVKILIENLEGKIELDSKEKIYTKFKISLPLS